MKRRGPKPIDLASAEAEVDAAGDAIVSAAARSKFPGPIGGDVDRDKLIGAADLEHWDYLLQLYEQEGRIDADTEERWRTVARLLAIQREVGRWLAELSPGAPAARPGDVRSRPISKSNLFRLAERRKPANTAEVSRWFRRHAAYLLPEPPDPTFRGKVTVNARLAFERLGIDPTMIL